MKTLEDEPRSANANRRLKKSYGGSTQESTLLKLKYSTENQSTKVKNSKMMTPSEGGLNHNNWVGGESNSAFYESGDH